MQKTPPKEKVLKNRKTKKRKKSRGKPASKGKNIRISDAVFGTLDSSRLKGESWDNLLRKILGLPNRRGEHPALVEGWLELNTGRLYLSRSEARGQAVVEAAKQGKKQISQPIFMREVPQ